MNWTWKQSWVRRLLVPHCDELTTFVIAVLTIVLAFVEDGIAKDLQDALSNADGPALPLFLIFAGLMCVLGFFMSIWHVCNNARKSEVEKRIMYISACVVNCIAAFSASRYLAQASRGITLLIPAYNIALAFSLVYQIIQAVVDKAEFDETEAKPLDTFIATLSALAILVTLHLGFRTHWSVTFSLSVIYATVFSATIGRRLIAALARHPPRPSGDSDTARDEGNDASAHTREDR